MRLRIKTESGAFYDFAIPDDDGLPMAVRCDWAEDRDDGSTDRFFALEEVSAEECPVSFVG